MENKKYEPVLCRDYQPKDGSPLHKGCGEEITLKQDETGRWHRCECTPLTVLVKDPESQSGFKAIQAWVPHAYTCQEAREWYVGFRAEQKAKRDEYFASKKAGGNFQKKQFNNGNYQKKPFNNSNYKQRAFTPQ